MNDTYFKENCKIVIDITRFGLLRDKYGYQGTDWLFLIFEYVKLLQKSRAFKPKPNL